jgi:anti-sigma B factor antagonist
MDANIIVDLRASELDPGLSLFRLKGHLDSKTVGELEARFEQELKSSRVRWIMDCKNLEYISSAGLKSFVNALPGLKGQSGDMFFINLPPKLGKIFKVMGFMELFKIFTSEAEAAQAFQRV